MGYQLSTLRDSRDLSREHVQRPRDNNIEILKIDLF